MGIGKSLADMPWGVIGPKAITYYVKQLDLKNNIQPIDIFLSCSLSMYKSAL